MSAPTDCGCSDTNDEGSQDWIDCIHICQNTDIPVNGNVWILLVAGAGIFIARERLIKKA